MNILAIGPHPDDVEFGCAPLLIQEVKNGNRVKILVLTKGEASSSGTPEERVQEARDAAAVIGAEVEFLDLGGDCHIRHTPESGFVIAREIRRFQPNIVLAPHLDENQHPDHVAAGRIARDAARLARYGGLANLKDLPVHPIDQLFFYNITQTLGPRPDILIDVSRVETEWEAAIRCHKSQMKIKGYLELVQARARCLGASLGVSAAIGLWVNDPIRVNSLSDLTLSSRNF
jgi:LmbE family N-acetylglucosaminyl deacetylase